MPHKCYMQKERLFLRVRLPVNPGAVVPTSPPMTRPEVMSGEGLP